MAEQSKMRTYVRQDCAVFCKTKEEFGELSNMSDGFPIVINDIVIRTWEALYQACRFPHLPEIQKLIISQASPISAKKATEPYRANSRPDWKLVFVKIMRWGLRVKLAQNFEKFSAVLLSTGDKPIVELSLKSDFWGAKPNANGELVGMNVTGRLLMELREELKVNSELLRQVDPLDIPDFLLYGKPIPLIKAVQSVLAQDSSQQKSSVNQEPGHGSKPAKRVINETQLSLFGEPDHAPAPDQLPPESPAENITDEPAIANDDRQVDVFAAYDKTDASVSAPVDLFVEPANVATDESGNAFFAQHSARVSDNGYAAEPVYDDTWTQMIVKMGLSGLTKEFAMNCALEKADEDGVYLWGDPRYRYLRNSRIENTLSKAIQECFGSALSLTMTTGSSASSDSAQKAANNYKTAQENAADLINADENIIALKQVFGARIIPGTIEDTSDSMSM